MSLEKINSDIDCEMGLPSSERGRCKVVLVIFKKKVISLPLNLISLMMRPIITLVVSVVRGKALEKYLVSKLPCGSPAPRAPQQGPWPPHSPIETDSAVNVIMCVCIRDNTYTQAYMYILTLT